MISFFYETDFKIKQVRLWKNWIKNSISNEGYKVGEVNYIFCDDVYLLEINQKYLNHNNYTDVIGFQYSEGNKLSGDIYISIERVSENALKNQVCIEEELGRVMIHGILHFMNYSDKTKETKMIMREKENQYLLKFQSMFHVERQ